MSNRYITIATIMLSSSISFCQTSFEFTNDKAVNGQIKVSNSGDKSDLKPKLYYQIFHGKYRKKVESDVWTLFGHTAEYALQKISTDSVKKEAKRYAIYEALKTFDRLFNELPKTTKDKQTRINEQYEYFRNKISKLSISNDVWKQINKIETTQSNIVDDISEVRSSYAESAKRVNAINDLLNNYQSFVDGVGIFYDKLALIEKYGKKQTNYKIHINNEEIAKSVLNNNSPHF